ncbi:GNAT family N-acetyltransferase [Yinghuangia sp. YIM S09857]|uniref:GNAT family N-acetyltransferase n=1 Tax=Yinghuangia sp. YIM S09857 TaxID=3436929 RepID=UPI003F529786
MGIAVRTFADADRTALRELAPRVGEGSPSGSLWGHPESEAAMYLDPYADLLPDSLWLAFLDGALVGYLAGCPDSAEFPSESRRMDRAIREHRLFLRARPVAFFARAVADAGWSALRRRPTAGDFADPAWPAHLHINLAPEARGTGAAQELMTRWLQQLRTAGSPGCHLQTLVENTRAVRFFRRMGFTPYGPQPMVPGLRHEGRRVHQLTMVQSL